jgi:transposase
MYFTRAVPPESQRLLQRIYRQSQHFQVRQRAHCILLRAQGMSAAELMRIFPVRSRKTLYNWFDEWDARGFAGLYNRPGRGRKPTFNDEQKAQIKQWAKLYPRALKRIVQKVADTWKIDVSTHTIKRVLKSMQMSWHRFRRVVAGCPDRQEYAQKQFALETLKRLAKQGELALYYLDQAGFSLTPLIPYGWQPIGETIEIPSQRSHLLNVLGLMSSTGELESYVSEQSITSDVVIACIDAFLPKVKLPTVIVMDKAPIHTSRVMRAQSEIWKQRGLYVFELPGYSPELNRIEILWRFMKYQWLEIDAYQSWQALVDSVEEILRNFGKDYVINFA